MTNTLFQDFDERSKEVSKYFLFIKSLEQETTKLSMEGTGRKIKTRSVDPELVKTLKASGFLLLYNLVESTMRNAIEAIFEEIRIQGISFDQVRPEIKRIVLKNFKKRNHDKVLLNMKALSLDIITACFDKEDLFSGNIDGRLVRDTANDYGFSHITNPIKTGNGSDLLTIKNNRNDLAHGMKSFAEVGRDQTADDLLRIKNRVINYLRQVLLNIETYLDNKEYLNLPEDTP